jgi:hypothetical protein
VSINTTDDTFMVSLPEAIEKWHETVKQVKLSLVSARDSFFDYSSYNIVMRELKYLKFNSKNKKLVIITDSFEFEKFALHFSKLDFPQLNVSVLTLAESRNLQYEPDYCLYFLTNKTELIIAKGSLSTVVITDSFEHINLFQKLIITSFVFPHVNEKYAFRGLIWIVRQAIKACLNAHNSLVILPKYWSSIAEPFDNETHCLPEQKYLALDYNSYICLYKQSSVISKSSQNGTAGKPIHQNLLIKDILMPLISNERLINIKNNHLELERKILES